ncbi:MAG TPA: phage GP46 family protein [Methylophilaceae bacterium]|nr:phage GP46 family protein [Methylophilaceae bacterium]
MTPLGSYWPDATFGSNLHLLQREKDVSRVSTLAKQYSEDALQPILVAERATSITVTTSQPHNSRLLLLIEVVDQTGRKLSFNHPVKVY